VEGVGNINQKSPSWHRLELQPRSGVPINLYFPILSDPEVAGKAKIQAAGKNQDNRKKRPRRKRPWGTILIVKQRRG
jgi:hypothetical protein